jgi:hypothetical protein
MKKTFLTIASACFLLTGCLETTQEITLKEDGSGTVSTTSDMSQLLEMLKQMGSSAEFEKAGNKAMDTTIQFSSQSGALEGLSEEEKTLLQNGSMNIQMNLQDHVFKTRLDFPFSNLGQMATFNKLSGRLFNAALKDKMEEMSGGSGMGGEVPVMSTFDDYYELEFNNGELKKKLNKDKYSLVATDEFFNGLKQAATMGIPIGTTYIINLPRPAEKAEGKNVKLSEDKMKVTINVELDDFLNDPEKLEFKIKY